MDKFTYKTKEEYIAEIQESLSAIEEYKVKYFHDFIMAKLGLMPCAEGGTANE